jgi:threonine dehydrogenase-like Zn-dependent dehydrogenase
LSCRSGSRRIGVHSEMAEKGETTRYSQIIAPRKSEVVSGPMPEPGSGQARIEVKACGVCASELHSWMEEHARYPFYLGHEASGVVHAVGPDVSDLAVGDRVTGLFAPAYAQFVLADQNSMLHIPDGIPFEAALGEPLACLVNAQRRTHVELADRVALVGAGFMGLGMLQLIALRGPARVIVIDVRQEALEKAIEFGADEAYLPADLPDEYLMTSWGHLGTTKGCHVVVEASGTQPGLTLAGKMVREHGILSILGYHQGEPRQVDMEMWNWKAIDVVNAHVRRHKDLMSSMRIGLDLMGAHKLSFEPLVTHRFGLDGVDDAFTALVEKPQGFVKAVVIP